MTAGGVPRAYLQPLVSRFLFLDMLLDAADCHAVVLFQPHRGRLDDVGFREFAGGVVGDGDDADVCDGGVA